MINNLFTGPSPPALYAPRVGTMEKLCARFPEVSFADRESSKNRTQSSAEASCVSWAASGRRRLDLLQSLQQALGARGTCQGKRCVRGAVQGTSSRLALAVLFVFELEQVLEKAKPLEVFLCSSLKTNSVQFNVCTL